MLRTGLTTTAVRFDYAPGDQILNGAFRPDTFMDLAPGDTMRDSKIALKTVGRDRFRVDSDILEIPRFHKVESFIGALARREVVRSNDVATGIIAGRPRAMSERTIPRHFLNTADLKYKPGSTN